MLGFFVYSLYLDKVKSLFIFYPSNCNFDIFVKFRIKWQINQPKARYMSRVWERMAQTELPEQQIGGQR